MLQYLQTVGGSGLGIHLGQCYGALGTQHLVLLYLLILKGMLVRQNYQNSKPLFLRLMFLIVMFFHSVFTLRDFVRVSKYGTRAMIFVAFGPLF